MGTYYQVKISTQEDQENKKNSMQAEVEQVLLRINQEMSTFLKDSHLARFNAAPANQWIELPCSLNKVMDTAQRLQQKSQGLYDVSVGPLVNLWGFGPDGRRKTPPTAEQVKDALGKVGLKYFEKKNEGNKCFWLKKKEGMRIDLSSIAKGYGVDEVADAIVQLGFKDFLVDIGGEVVLKGKKHDGSLWKIAVERPSPEGQGLQRVLTLSDEAIATSGDYRNFFETKGRRFSHTINPLTGESVAHQLASVTIVADNCMLADAWATALNVMGEQKAQETMERESLKAYLILRTDKGFEEIESTAFKQAFGKR